ncbi:MAG: hypothetical protein AAF703_21450 [Cyanobacteria bacterium P01_D01_bin.105]
MKKGYRIRPVTSADEPILWEMLRYAAHEPALETVKTNSELA